MVNYRASQWVKNGFTITKSTKRVAKSMILATFLVNLLMTAGVASAQDMGIQAYGLDTFAGSPTILKTSRISPDQEINFVVSKPDGLVLTLPARTDLSGVAKLELYDYHTKKAGEYTVAAYLRGERWNDLSGRENTFRVFASDLSVEKSTVEIDRTMIKADGIDLANVKVKLVDDFENPLVGHSVKMVSSRSEDRIQAKGPLTNEKGEMEFVMASSVKGLSGFTIMDTTEDAILDQRVSVAFMDGAMVADAGGDLIKTAFAQDAGPLAGFELSGFPTSIKAKENVSFKVRAIDAEGLTVQNYTGTIRFSAEGDNSSGVDLPENYKFLAEDLGEHQFNLGLSFTEDGTYKVLVNDLNDKFKAGEKTVVVTSASGSSGSLDGEGSGNATINSPAPGTYSQNVQTISGNVPSSTLVQIFDNNMMIGSTPVGVTGAFSFQTPLLNEGKHEFYVVAMDQVTNEVKATSNKVQVTIDTTAPKIEQLDIAPKTGITAGSVIDVAIYSDANLSQAAAIFNFDIVELSPSIEDPSKYVGQVQAPAQPGIYPIDFLLVDELGNEVTLKSVAELNIDPNGGTIVQEELPNTEPENNTPENNEPEVPVINEPAEGLPSQVSGLIAYGSDKRITLVWDAATDDKLVQKYKIYYGAEVQSLSQTVETKDASTTWYIPGLENGKEYFFSITAIDSEGNESENRSEIVSGIPFVLEINNALENKPDQSIQEGNVRPAAYTGELPNRTPNNGPGVLILLAGSAVSGFVFTRKKK
ncbi:MAG: Ig-like domain-containing protein [Candidatus Altimarinota bacterium]